MQQALKPNQHKRTNQTRFFWFHQKPKGCTHVRNKRVYRISLFKQQTTVKRQLTCPSFSVFVSLYNTCSRPISRVVSFSQPTLLMPWASHPGGQQTKQTQYTPQAMLWIRKLSRSFEQKTRKVQNEKPITKTEAYSTSPGG